MVAWTKLLNFIPHLISKYIHYVCSTYEIYYIVISVFIIIRMMHYSKCLLCQKCRTFFHAAHLDIHPSIFIFTKRSLGFCQLLESLNFRIWWSTFNVFWMCSNGGITIPCIVLLESDFYNLCMYYRYTCFNKKCNKLFTYINEKPYIL